MVVYADTSLLTAYYCSERGSDQAQAYLAAQSNIAISGLTETELISALSKKVRARDIAAGDARKIAALALRENIILATADVKLAEATKRLGGNVNFIDYAMSGR